MIKTTHLSSTFAIDEIWPPCIRVTITLLDRVVFLLIVLWEISEEYKPCLEVTSSTLSSKWPLSNLKVCVRMYKWWVFTWEREKIISFFSVPANLFFSSSIRTNKKLISIFTSFNLLLFICTYFLILRSAY